MKDSGKLTVLAALALAASVAVADEYQLVTGVNAGMAPGTARSVLPVPGAFAFGDFTDGQRLAGLSDASATSYLGGGVPMFGANEFGSMSFMFRRGSIPTGSPVAPQVPLMSIDYLGGPLLDLDGDLGNGSRRLTPAVADTPVAIPGSQSFVDLSFDHLGGAVSLGGFDATANNAGASVSTAAQVISVNTLAGTSVNGVPGAAINPGIDTRSGTLTSIAPGLTQISSLGYEIWQDSIDSSSSQAGTLGTQQFLGSLDGWKFERDGSGDFPDLSSIVLGGTQWPAVNTSQVGSAFVTASHPFEPVATIVDHIDNGAPDFITTDDLASVALGNGGLTLSDFADLADYFETVVYPSIDPLSESFVYLSSAGFGINNSFDPIFGDSVGYDVVLVAQSTPVPEPATIGLLAVGIVGAGLGRRRIR